MKVARTFLSVQKELMAGQERPAKIRSSPMIQHMVLLRFKPDISEQQIDRLFEQVDDLKRVVPGMRYFAGGKYSSPEGLNQGFTHGFLVTFDDVAARDAYLAHPDHDRVKDDIIPCIDAVVAFDFQA
jgi:hypothetical protein